MGNEEEVKSRWCPFLKEWCTEEVSKRCAISMVMMGTGRQAQRMCSFSAVVIILSEINQKTPAPQREKIVLPGLGR